MLIGEFAAASQLSVRMLRHYHDTGLLEPRFVDPASGYRYYAAGQLSRAGAIGLLRAAEMPLADIAIVLGDNAAMAAETLARHRQRLADRRSAVDRSLNVVERLVEQAWTMSLAVSERHLETITVATARVEGPRSFLDPLLTSAFLKLSRAIAASGVKASAPLQLVYQGDETRFAHDVCFPIPPGTTIEGYETIELPSVDVAFAEHVGPPDGISLSVAAVIRWLTERGRHMRFPLRMEFLAAPPLLGKGDAGVMATNISVPFD